MPDTGVGLMAKFPREGEVKTRLAESIGEQKALDVYLSLLRRTCRLVTTLDTAAYHRAAFVASANDCDSFLSAYPGFDLYASQRGNDLGQRMKNALQQLLSRPDIDAAMLIGADCPELDSTLFGTARDHLSGHDLVLGPTIDGGYYLIGLNKIYPALFEKIKWSTRAVFEKTMIIAERHHMRIALLPKLRDLDNEDDLAYFMATNQIDGIT